MYYVFAHARKRCDVLCDVTDCRQLKSNGCLVSALSGSFCFAVFCRAAMDTLFGNRKISMKALSDFSNL